MRGKLLLAFALAGLIFSGCTSVSKRESTYTLNGKQVAIAGEQHLKSPKGNEVEIIARNATITIVGEEEVVINGRKIRAYGDKVEVNGLAYPVGAGQTLAIMEEGIMIRAAGGAAEGGE